MSRIAAGDEQAFETLVRSESALVFGRALSILRQNNLAEEVTQEVFAKVWKKAATFDVQRGSVRAWLHVLTRSTSVDHIRVEERHKSRTRAAVRSITRNTNEVEESVHTRASGEAVRAALINLKDGQREPIELAFFDGLTYREVAERLNIPEGTAKARIRRGLIQLSRVLSGHDDV